MQSIQLLEKGIVILAEKLLGEFLILRQLYLCSFIDSCPQIIIQKS